MGQFHRSCHGQASAGRAICLVIIAFGLSALTATAQRPPEPLSTPEIASKVTPTVLTITTPTGSGSGVVVDGSGVLVTNLHVIRGATEVTVTLANGDVYDDVAVVDVDERRDLVLLKIKAFGLIPASFGDSDAMQVGESVVLVGSPEGLDLTVSEGVISALRDSGDGYQLLQTSAPASPGSSGGGMFNEYGELVGIVTSQLPDGQNLNFAVPINYVRGILATEARMTLTELTERIGGGSARDTGAAVAVASDTRDPASIARLAEIIDAAGGFEPFDDTRWVTSYNGGDYLDEITVVVTLFTDSIVLVQGITPDPEPPWTASQLTALLELNYELNFVKVALDPDGSVWPMAEVELRTLDGPGLDLIVSSVALAADEVAGILQLTAIPTEDAVDLTRLEIPGREALTFLNGHLEFFYNPSEWIEEPAGGEYPDVDKAFTHSSGEVFLSLIVERAEIPIQAMYGIALANAQSLDPKLRATRRGSRSVNGVQLGFQEMKGTIEGVPFFFLAHYYSDSGGTIQIVGSTFSNLIDVHRNTIERFVAGFEVVDR